LLNFDPNCKCFDPTTQLVLNPNAWSDAPQGTFERQRLITTLSLAAPATESLSLARNFKLAAPGGQPS
jgi:hypothetical protein